MLWREGGILMILIIVCMQPALISCFLQKLAGPCKLKSEWWYQIIRTATVVDMAFSANSMTSRHLKTAVFVKSLEEIEWPQFSKLWLLRCPKLSQSFLSSFCWVLPAAWPLAAAPEAKHRCIWQPSKATIAWSRGSSRRRRPWMHRTNGVVASEEDSVGKSLEAWDRCEVEEMLMV